MRILRDLWNDEVGVILSAEAVVLGTVGVVGLTAGLSVVSKAVNGELKDLAFAIRSLDQSYEIPAQRCCGAYTAGSSFKQEPVEKSLAILCEMVEKAERQEKSQNERLEKQVKEQQTKEMERKKNSDNDKKRSDKKKKEVEL